MIYEKDYTLAVSFAKESRTYVSAIVKCLEAMGIKSFYDANEQCSLHLIGEQLDTTLTDIYSSANIFIVFLSPTYFTKTYPLVEWKCIYKNRQKAKIIFINLCLCENIICENEEWKSYISNNHIIYDSLKKNVFLVSHQIAKCVLNKENIKFDFDPFYKMFSTSNFLEAAQFLEAFYNPVFENKFLTIKERVWCSYNIACCYSKNDKTINRSSKKLKKGLTYIKAFFRLVVEHDNSNVEEYIKKFDTDDDLMQLRLVLKINTEEIVKKITDKLYNANCNYTGTSGCFTKDTRVMTREGSLSISELKYGDEIFSYDFKNAKKIITKVNNVFELESDLIMINDVKISPKQKIYTKEYGWVCARDLKVNMHILGYSKMIEVINKHDWDSKETVYNIETNHNSHNYYADGMLVHNWK